MVDPLALNLLLKIIGCIFNLVFLSFIFFLSVYNIPSKFVIHMYKTARVKKKCSCSLSCFTVVLSLRVCGRTWTWTYGRRTKKKQKNWSLLSLFLVTFLSNILYPIIIQPKKKISTTIKEVTRYKRNKEKPQVNRKKKMLAYYFPKMLNFSIGAFETIFTVDVLLIQYVQQQLVSHFYQCLSNTLKMH
jgi:hypothetical protein